jgi:hypothetical protein
MSSFALLTAPIRREIIVSDQRYTSPARSSQEGLAFSTCSETFTPLHSRSAPSLSDFLVGWIGMLPMPEQHAASVQDIDRYDENHGQNDADYTENSHHAVE